MLDCTLFRNILLFTAWDSVMAACALFQQSLLTKFVDELHVEYDLYCQTSGASMSWHVASLQQLSCEKGSGSSVTQSMCCNTHTGDLLIRYSELPLRNVADNSDCYKLQPIIAYTILGIHKHNLTASPRAESRGGRY